MYDTRTGDDERATVISSSRRSYPIEDMEKKTAFVRYVGRWWTFVLFDPIS